MTLTEVHSFEFGNCRDASFSDSYVAFVGDAVTVRDIGTWTNEVFSLNDATDYGRCEFSHDGSLLAFGDSSGPSMRVFETSGWTEYNVGIDNIGSIYTHPRFSSDDSYMFTTDNTDQMEIWNVAGDQNWTLYDSKTLDSSNNARAAASHHDGYFLASNRTDEKIYLYDIASQTIVDTDDAASGNVPTDVYTANGHPTDPYIMTAGSGEIVVYDISSGSLTFETSISDYGTTYASVMGEDFIAATTNSDAIYTHFTSDWSLDDSLAISYEALESSAFSNDSEYLAVPQRSGNTAHIYDVERPITTLDVTGNIILDGSAVQGATVIGVNDTQEIVEDITTTDSNGDYTLSLTDGDTAHILVQYDDGGGNQYNDQSKPFIVMS